MPLSLRIVAALSLLLALSIAMGADQAAASTRKYTPVFGKGTHTVWDEELSDYGDTYGYEAVPTDYGWFTSVWAKADYSTLVFVCYYEEETDSALMAVRFYLNDRIPFSDESVTLPSTIGEFQPIPNTFFRRDEDDAIVETYVSGLDRSRASKTFSVDIGPFTFNHDIEGLFDVPVASNIIWCDDRDLEPG